MADDASRRPTLVDKIWGRHEMTELAGERLLYVDYLLLHEGARHAFDDLDLMRRRVSRPLQVIACADHYVPTRAREQGLAGVGDPTEARNIIQQVALLELKLVQDGPLPSKEAALGAHGGVLPPDTELLPGPAGSNGQTS